MTVSTTNSNRLLTALWFCLKSLCFG